MNNNLRVGLRIVGGLMMAALLGTTTPGAAVAAEPLRVKLEWLPGAIHAWYHLAMEKGWYKDAGLNVEIEDGKGSAIAIQLVGAGNFEIGGCISLGAAAIGRAKGVPVKSIAAMAQKSDMGFVFPKGKGWKSPKDMVDAGAKIVITPGDVWAPFLETVFKVGGSDVKKAQLLSVSPAAKMSSYISGGNNIAMTTVPPYALPIVNKEQPSDALMLYDIGLKLPGWGLISSDDAIKKRPDEIRKFVMVTMRAFDYVTNGREAEGVDAIIKARPDGKVDRDQAIQQLKLYNPLFHGDTKGKPSGYMSPDDWKAAFTLMAQVDLIPANANPNDYYTNDFVQ